MVQIRKGAICDLGNTTNNKTATRPKSCQGFVQSGDELSAFEHLEEAEWRLSEGVRCRHLVVFATDNSLGATGLFVPPVKTIFRKTPY